VLCTAAGPPGEGRRSSSAAAETSAETLADPLPQCHCRRRPSLTCTSVTSQPAVDFINLVDDDDHTQREPVLGHSSEEDPIRGDDSLQG